MPVDLPEAPEPAPRATPDFDQALELFTAGRFPEAAAVCRRLLKADPEQARALHMLARILMGEGQFEEGLGWIEKAHRLNPQNPDLLAAHGRLLLYLGRLDEAVGVLGDALKLNADGVEAHHNLAIALQNLGRLEDAEREARAAVALQPQFPELLGTLGTILVKRGDYQQGHRCFETALAAAPDNPIAIGLLALWNEQTNRIAEALQLAERGLALHPQDATLRLVMARCRRHRGEYQAALAILRDMHEMPESALRKDVDYELALCSDALGEPDAAIGYAMSANHIVSKLWPQVHQRAQDFTQLVERLAERFTVQWVTMWSASGTADEHRAPIFLVGFPRSGTTLLDTMLDGHPDLAVLEEPPAVQAVVNAIAGLNGGYPDALADLTAAQRARLEAEYYRWVSQTAIAGGKRLVDKSPLCSIHMGAIQRVFPGAPVLFMVRHPCDVVLSCCMTNFTNNAATANFLTLESTVSLYCKVMTLWQSYLQVLQPQVMTVRYADLISDPEKELRGILAFLNLPWSPRVLDYARHAQNRGRINSASYAQVTKPLYRSARDRWRRYTRHLEPYLSRLRPWCDKFGYDT